MWQKIQRYDLWLLWLATGLLIPVASSFDDRRLILITIIGIVPAYATIRRRWIAPSYLLCVGGFLVLAFGSLAATFCREPSWALLAVGATFLLTVSTSALAANFCYANFSSTTIIGWGFVLPVTLVCIANCITIYSSFFTGFPLRYPEPLRDFANIRFFNQYQTWTLPFLSAAIVSATPFLRVRFTVWRMLVIVIAIFFWALYWHSSGRGTGYATFIATLVVAAVLGSAGRAHACRTFMLAAAGCLVSFLMFGLSGGGTMNARLISDSSPGRWYLWHIAINHVMSTPWLGIGPMMFAAIDTGEASHPHNAPLQWAVEWGVPAAVLIMACIGWLAYRWLCIACRYIDRVEKTESSLIVAVTAALIAGSVHALVSGVIVMPASQFMLVTVVALAVGIATKKDTTATIHYAPKRIRLGSISFSIVTFIALIYVSVFTLYDYFTRISQPKTETPVYIRNSFQPRYWADGTLTTLVQPPIPTSP